jgi:branched-chain amino acid transport system permease protein
MGVLYIARAFITVIVGGPMALLGTSVAASVLGTIEALISRIPLFHIVTSGFCSPPPCTISIGGSAFFGQVALLLLAILILRLRPQGLTGAHLRR